MRGRGVSATLTAFFALGLCTSCLAADTVARVGSTAVDASALRAAIARSGLPVNDPASARKALDELLGFEALAAEAKKLGYDRLPEIEEQTKRMMVNRLVAEKVDQTLDRTPPTEAELKSYYDRHQAEFRSPALARGQVATLLVRDSKEATMKVAKDAVELTKTKKFDDVVKQFSDFAAERLNSADTGWLVLDQPNKRYPTAVLKALQTLAKPGELAAPIVTDRAVFLVRLAERRESAVPSFEELKPGLRQAVERERRQRAYDALVNQARQAHGVKVEEAGVQKVVEQQQQAATPPPAPFRAP